MAVLHQGNPRQFRHFFGRLGPAAPGHYFPDSSSTSVVPNAAVLGDTRMPAAFIASILLSAPPLPPEMMAPPWPMRRPGGAVTPAMKTTMGFLTLECLTKAG